MARWTASSSERRPSWSPLEHEHRSTRAGQQPGAVQDRAGQGSAVQCSSVQRTRAVHSRRSETLKSSSSSRLVVLRLGGKAAGPREGRRRGSVVMASLVAVEGRADGVTSELWDSIADNLPGAKTKTYGSRLRGCPYEDSRIATVSLVTENPRGRTVSRRWSMSMRRRRRTRRRRK